MLSTVASARTVPSLIVPEVTGVGAGEGAWAVDAAGGVVLLAQAASAAMDTAMATDLIDFVIVALIVIPPRPVVPGRPSLDHEARPRKPAPAGVANAAPSAYRVDRARRR